MDLDDLIMVFTLKIFNSVISLRFKNSAPGLFRTDKLKLHHRDLFLANYLLALGSHLESADDPSSTAEPSKNTRLLQDRARKLRSFFSCNYIQHLSWQRISRQFMKSKATKVTWCLLWVVYSCWFWCSSPSARGYLLKPTALPFVCIAISSKLELIEIGCYCQQLLFFCYCSGLI